MNTTLPPQELVDYYYQYAGQDASNLESSMADASFRQYFRSKKPSLLAVHAPPDKERVQEFVQIQQLLKSHSIRVPEIYTQDLSRGFFLIEDLGCELFSTRARQEKLEDFMQLGNIITKIQNIAKPVWIKDHNRSTLMTEMKLFCQWFLKGLLHIDPTEHTHPITPTFNAIADLYQQHPQTLVHYDMHCRNIMIVDNDFALIDFQDALWGSVGYDLAALLKDCYIRYQPNFVEEICFNTLQRQDAMEIVDIAGLQRHIRILGVFSRLSLRDSKHDYLPHLPLTLHYVIETTLKYESTKEFSEWLGKIVIDHCIDMPWYKPWSQTSK